MGGVPPQQPISLINAGSIGVDVSGNMNGMMKRDEIKQRM